jgi:hypothetical protein
MVRALTIRTLEMPVRNYISKQLQVYHIAMHGDVIDLQHAQSALANLSWAYTLMGNVLAKNYPLRLQPQVIVAEVA